MAHRPLVATLTALAALVAGCHNLDAPAPYQADVLPERYASASEHPENTLDLRQQDARQLQQSLAQWWLLFDDPTLNHLVAHAQQANWELRASTQRIEQARAQISRINAMALPSLSVDANASRQQSGTASKLGFGLYDLYGFSANLAWEPDIFGRISAQSQAAQAQLDIASFETRALMVATVAELVESYAQLRTVQALRALTRQYVKVLSQQVQLTEQLVRTGLTPSASAATMRSELLDVQAQLPAMDVRIATLSSTIAILAGGFPQAFNQELGKSGRPLSVEHPIPDTLPSQLLSQRPDLAAQQARLSASLSEIQAAQADFMPKFSIPLSIGYSTTPFDLLLNPASFIWNLGASLAAPLYTGGALEANLAIAKSSNRQDQLRYEGMVRQALKEVGDAIIGYQQSQSRLQDTQTMTQQIRKVFEQQQRLFETGQTSRLQLNQAKLQWLSAQQALLDARYATVVQLIGLYRALGGGWQPEQTVADSPR